MFDQTMSSIKWLINSKESFLCSDVTHTERLAHFTPDWSVQAAQTPEKWLRPEKNVSCHQEFSWDIETNSALNESFRLEMFNVPRTDQAIFNMLQQAKKMMYTCRLGFCLRSR